MTDSAVQNFASLLAAADTDAERARLISRAKMLAVKEVPEEKLAPPIKTVGEYLASEIPIPPALVTPTLVVRGEITTTLGRAGKGKTTYNLNRIIRWSAGKPLFDDFRNKEEEAYLMPYKPLKTLVIENEGSAGMFHTKLKKMINAPGYLTDEEKELVNENMLIWGDGGWQGVKLDDPNVLNTVREGCEIWEPDILFIEPFRGLWKGEENSSTDMANVIDNIIGIATDYKCGVILSHHEKKGGAGEDDPMSAARGSTVLEGAVAVMENFRAVKDEKYREVTWSKARYLQPPPSMRMEFQRDDEWYAFVPFDEIEQQVIETLQENEDEPLTKSELCEAMDEEPRKLARILTKMHEDEKIKRMPPSRGQNGSSGYRYRLPSPQGDDDEKGMGF